MSGHILVLFGASGSGKDTIAEYLVKKGGYLHFKFAGLMKRTIEQWYGLEPFILDTQEGKAQPLPGNANETFGSLLVGCYHLWERFDDGMTARPTVRQIEESLEGNTWSVVLSDMRKPVEAELILDFARRTDRTIHICIVSGRGKMLSTDTRQDLCCSILQRHNKHTMTSIKNDADIKSLLSQVKKARRLVWQHQQ